MKARQVKRANKRKGIAAIIGSSKDANNPTRETPTTLERSMYTIEVFNKDTTKVTTAKVPTLDVLLRQLAYSRHSFRLTVRECPTPKEQARLGVPIRKRGEKISY